MKFRVLVIFLLLPIDSMASELKIGEVYPHMSLEEVRAKLGIEQMSRDFADGISLETYYSNIIVQFDSEYVMGAYTQSKNICTPEGVCPQQDISRAISVYGEKYKFREDGRYDFIVEGEFCWYRLYAPNEAIEWMALVCQP